MVSEVTNLIAEMQRITVLWEERWLNTLQQRQGDVTRRIQRLSDEANRMAENSTLSDEDKTRLMMDRHTAIMAPVLASIERVMEETIDSEPATPHECWFIETYGQRIRAALSTLRSPDLVNCSPKASWAAFEMLADELKARMSKRTSLNQKLSDLSPILARVSGSRVPMPGVEAVNGEQVKSATGCER